MKILFYYHTSFDGTVLGMLFDEAKKFINNSSNKVYFVNCDAFQSYCLVNSSGKESICKFCKKRFKKLISDNFDERLNILNLNEYIDYKKVRFFDYNSADELKMINYNDIPIGYSTLSSYIQLTRNQDPLIDAQAKNYFDIQLNQSVNLIDAFESIFEDIKPDLVCSYNGRFNEIRPVYETAKKLDINTRLYEMVPEFDGTYNKVYFDNCMPHDIKKNIWRIEYNWENSKYTTDQKIKKANEFFIRRRKGLVAGDKVYTNEQKRDLLPTNFNSDKINIAIFNSSEDEFVSLGGEYVSKSLFNNQLEGLETLFDNFKERTDYHFYLRVHPNLSNVRYKYHTNLKQFEKIYNNVTVISADSKVSSYKLIDVCDKIIVFGSTTGLEAVYWGKPVILLTCCLYYYYDFCYKPNNLSDFLDLVKEDLKSKYNIDVLKVGFYFYDKSSLYIEGDRQYKYINFNPIKIKLFNHVIHGYHYQKLFGSSLLSLLYVNIKRLLYKKFSMSGHELPIND